MGEYTVSIDVPVAHMQNLFGQFDSHIKKIEDDLQVMIINRDGAVRVSGEKESVDQAVRIVKELLSLSERGNVLEEQRVVILNKYEYGMIINSLNELRTKLIRENKSTEFVNELLLRLLNIPIRKRTIFQRERVSNER